MASNINWEWLCAICSHIKPELNLVLTRTKMCLNQEWTKFTPGLNQMLQWLYVECYILFVTSSFTQKPYFNLSMSNFWVWPWIQGLSQRLEWQIGAPYCWKTAHTLPSQTHRWPLWSIFTIWVLTSWPHDLTHTIFLLWGWVVGINVVYSGLNKSLSPLNQPKTSCQHFSILLYVC